MANSFLNMNKWNETSQVKPEMHELVETLCYHDSPYVQKLIYRGSLWFLPDGSMYVYYTPVFWRSYKKSIINQPNNER
jgi:hypothetical protein